MRGLEVLGRLIVAALPWITTLLALGLSSQVNEDGSGVVSNVENPMRPDSTLQLTETLNINDRGEIVGRGLPAGGDNLDLRGRVFVLTLCDAAGARDCEGAIDLNAQPRSAIASAIKMTPGSSKDEGVPCSSARSDCQSVPYSWSQNTLRIQSGAELHLSAFPREEKP